MKRLHAIVEGRVQGVGYRFFVAALARDLRIKGWARNLPDGGVEVVAEGEDGALARLALCLEAGPPLSRVDEVRLTYQMPTGEFADFRVRG